ncbi:PREDICTED: uncharacterized protein LOC105367432 [Ceratosolen solmsi marchali]|uniref:Uncharacterized protein LOC105367432 n=1 Tax=Ceratosolen solmsi marchali TaxID=326594 RepID=A0AAJ6YU70_9HYME|nr:PREDICTED: uncharacterized protein LOC105367432 [Ceratosolen solmsi marchali]
MRVGEMLCEAVRPLFILFLVIAVHANALPLQYLPDIPGYVPVYIRYGDQPLEEINPTLAEAFHESSSIIKVRLH